MARIGGLLMLTLLSAILVAQVAEAHESRETFEVDDHASATPMARKSVWNQGPAGISNAITGKMARAGRTLEHDGIQAVGSAVETLASAVGSAVETLESLNHGAVGSAVETLSKETSHLPEFEQKTQFCYEKDHADPVIGCWAHKPPADTPACTPHSGETVCKCPFGGCTIDKTRADPPITGRCAIKHTYVAGGMKRTENDQTVVLGNSAQTYCRRMVLHDEWASKRIAKHSDDGPSYTDDYWKCWYPYTSHAESCFRRKRFLNEYCWEGWNTAGCATDPSNAGHYRVSCHKSNCVPNMLMREATECTCASFEAHLYAVCSAKSNGCGGHACVRRNFATHKFYCDYDSDKGW